MSTTAEPEAHPKLSARAQLVTWLQSYLPRVSEQDPTAELTRQARRLGGDSDPMIAHFIRECEEQEQRARERRHDKQQRQIEQRIEQQQAIAQAETTQQQLDLWFDGKLALAIGIDGKTPRHPSIAALLDAIGEVNAMRDEAVRKKIEAAKKYTDEMVRAFTKEIMARFSDLETPIRTHFQCHNDAIEQVTQRLTTIEGMVATMGASVDDLKRELADNISQRMRDLEIDYQDQHGTAEKQHAAQSKMLSERLTAVEQQSGDLKRAAADDRKQLSDLEDAYWSLRGTDQRQRDCDEKNSAEQTKTINDRLTAVEQHSGDLKRELADGSKRLGDLENTYWSQRDSDQHQRDEQANKVTEKLNGFAQQVIDFAHELKEIRRDLKRATDMTQEIHAMELRLDERRIAADKAKRGARGEAGPKGARGAKGDTGPAGKAGRDGHDGRDAQTIASWQIDPKRYAVAPMMSDGNIGAVLPLRELFVQYQQETS